MTNNVDPEELERFSRIAAEWWDPKGKFRPLHKMNPVRLSYVKEQICAQFGRDYKSSRALDGLRVLDVGCGGGLLSEPLSRMGAQMTSIDPAERNISIAALHAEQTGAKIDYRPVQAEELVGDGEQFDVVVCLEVVEHVPDVRAFINTVGQLVAPGGVLLLSTINRTMKSFALAIVGAEYILRWLPRGTHQWQRFVTPEELQTATEQAGLVHLDSRGAVFNPLFDEWHLSRSDLDVNYFLTALQGEV